MRIGIITIQRSEVNYGACLQSFALWKYITELGHDCEIIDILRPCHVGYKESKIFQEHKSFFLGQIKKLLLRIRKKQKAPSVKFQIKREKFDEFNSLSIYSETFHSIDELYRASPNYDIYITGSDQVWNPQRKFIKDPYFLTFAPSGKKKISYASSFAVESLPDAIKPQYSKWLSSYNSISTREQSGSAIVEELTGRKAFVAVDPVFLLSGEKWNEYAKAVAGITPQQYIFLYLLHYNEEYVNYAAAVAKEKELPLYMVISANILVDNPSVVQLNEIGPREWLWLICHSKMTITTSFHGSAFCTIYNTPLIVLMKNGVATNTRISELLLNVDASYDEGIISPELKVLKLKTINKEKQHAMVGRSYNYLASNFI